MSDGPDRPVPDLDVTVVESVGCHLCADAQEVLAELSATYPLKVTTLQMDTDAGRALIATHRPALSPLVLVDGAFFSHGRLPRRKLARLLAERSGTPARAGGA